MHALFLASALSFCKRTACPEPRSAPGQDDILAKRASPGMSLKCDLKRLGCSSVAMAAQLTATASFLAFRFREVLCRAEVVARRSGLLHGYVFVSSSNLIHCQAGFDRSLCTEGHPPKQDCQNSERWLLALRLLTSSSWAVPRLDEIRDEGFGSSIVLQRGAAFTLRGPSTSQV